MRYNPSILYFGMPMGLIGAGVNAQHLAVLLDLQHSIADGLLFYGWLSFAVISLHYLWHCLGIRKERLLQEWLDPAELSFFPAITLTSLLFVLSLYPVLEEHSISLLWLERAYLLIAGLHGLLNLKLLSSWLFHSHVEIKHHQPSWYILLSGNFMVVISGMQLIDISQFPIWYEVLWLFFSVALILWFSFTVSLFYKLLFEKPMYHKVRPSLFIFLAPPSLATIASLLLMGEVEGGVNGVLVANQVPIFAWILFSFATLMLLLWISLLRFFYQGGLSMVAWAYVYPLAAYGLACQFLAEKMDSLFFIYLSIFVLLFVISTIALLTVWIAKQVFQKKVD